MQEVVTEYESICRLKRHVHLVAPLLELLLGQKLYQIKME